MAIKQAFKPVVGPDEMDHLVVCKMESAQERHFMEFAQSGSKSYMCLAKNLLTLDRVAKRILRDLDTLDEEPRFTRYDEA